jgi:DNA-directed RNA polymerase subunit B
MDGSLIIRIDINREVTLYLPFQVLYKIFNINSDREIFNTILPNYDSKNNRDVCISVALRTALSMAYTESRKDGGIKSHFKEYFDEETGKIVDDPAELVLRLAEVINDINKSSVTYTKYNTNRNNREKMSATINLILEKLDNIIFPHIGITAESRIDKLHYLGSLINGVYGVKFGDEPSDRNSMANQIVATTSLVLIMSFKSMFNLTVVSKIIRDIQKHFGSTEDPRNVKISHIIKQNLNTDDLKKGLCKAIKAGNNPKIKVNKQITANRVVTNVLERTNRTATLGTLRSIRMTGNIGGKTNDAVTASRNIHASGAGIVCPIRTVEGANTGVIGEFAISTEFSDIILSQDIENEIINDPEVEPKNKVSSSSESTYSWIIMNGKPICSHHNTKAYATKLRNWRREGKRIHRNTSIIYHPLKRGELEINTQKGRPLRPLVIVYNNLDKFIEGKEPFRQWVRFTIKHSDMLAKRQIDMNYLIEENIIEMISPIEYKNILVAKSIEYFEKLEANPLHQFTHVDLPLSNFSISTLSCPLIDHSATVRSAYESNQRRQTLGVPVFNYYSVFYGKLSVAFNAFMPLTTTIVNHMVRPDGGPLYVLVKAEGNNQEDSLIVSESLVDFGRFSIIYYVSTMATLETNQYFGSPKPTTMELRATDYSHLVEGVPKKGTVIKKGMPIIGIIEKDSKDPSITRDRSIIHKKNTPIIVDAFNKSHNIQGYRSITVRTHSIRHTEAGDKFSSRQGGKAIISGVTYLELLPVSENGISPDAILNPHAFPSRMILNQMMDGARSKLCTLLGVQTDISIYANPQEDEFLKLLSEYKLENCTEVFYNDVTGEQVQNKMFMTPIFYQRLSKMIKDHSSAVDKPTIDIRTQQTHRGVNKGGGTKMGEMEKDDWLAIGVTNSLTNKMLKDSDRKMAYTCDRCGKYAAVNISRNLYKCPYCMKNQELSTFSEAPSSFATFNLIAHLSILGIGTNMRTRRPIF